MFDYDLIIVGNGLAAHALLNELSKNKLFQTKKILQVYDEVHHPACSYKTTGVVCLSGIQKGVSPLGDQIYNSYQVTEQLFLGKKFAGVYSGASYQLCDDDELSREDFKRRFGSVEHFDNFSGNNLKHSFFGKRWDSYLIKPENFLPSLEKSYFDYFSNFEKREGVVSNINHRKMEIDGKKISFDKALLCSGAYTKYEFFDLNNNIIGNTKVVPGAYLTYKDIDLGESSFVISKKHANLVYRAFEKSVLIGGSTIKKEYGYKNDLEEIKEQYNLYIDILKNMDKKLPVFEEAEVEFGLRHKGRQRMPFAGRLKDNIYGLFGLYKNGFTFPFYLAKKLVDEIQKELEC